VIFAIIVCFRSRITTTPTGFCLWVCNFG